jgi:hypothetical protein
MLWPMIVRYILGVIRSSSLLMECCGIRLVGGCVAMAMLPRMSTIRFSQSSYNNVRYGTFVGLRGSFKTTAPIKEIASVTGIAVN